VSALLLARETCSGPSLERRALTEPALEVPRVAHRRSSFGAVVQVRFKLYTQSRAREGKE
jgi:hypothetical protein